MRHWYDEVVIQWQQNAEDGALTKLSNRVVLEHVSKLFGVVFSFDKVVQMCCFFSVSWHKCRCYDFPYQ